jgi:hypothetical protein
MLIVSGWGIAFRGPFFRPLQALLGARTVWIYFDGFAQIADTCSRRSDGCKNEPWFFLVRGERSGAVRQSARFMALAI